jgi:uncharacterized membrane protein
VAVLVDKQVYRALLGFLVAVVLALLVQRLVAQEGQITGVRQEAVLVHLLLFLTGDMVRVVAEERD